MDFSATAAGRMLYFCQRENGFYYYKLEIQTCQLIPSSNLTQGTYNDEPHRNNYWPTKDAFLPKLLTWRRWFWVP